MDLILPSSVNWFINSTQLFTSSVDLIAPSSLNLLVWSWDNLVRIRQRAASV